MNMYRCTRRRPYPKGTPGFLDVSARQGHYIQATSEEQATHKMAEAYPDEAAVGFDVQLWSENVDGRDVPARYYLLDWLKAEQSINNEGEPDSIQRLVYKTARATTPAEWAEVYRLANVVHGQCMDDTGLGLLLNALCATAAQAYKNR